MKSSVAFPIGTRVVAYRERFGPARCRVIAVSGDTRTLREIWNKNTVKGVAARVKYYAYKNPFTVTADQLELEGPPEADGPAYSEMPPYVPAGDA